MIRLVDMRWVGCADWDHPSALHFDLLVVVDGPLGAPEPPSGAGWRSKRSPWCRVHANGGCGVENLARDVRNAVEGSDVQRHGRDPEGFPHAWYGALAGCFMRHFGKPGGKYLQSQCDPEDGADLRRFEAFREEWWTESAVIGLKMSGILDRPGSSEAVERILRQVLAREVLEG